VNEYLSSILTTALMLAEYVSTRKLS